MFLFSNLHAKNCSGAESRIQKVQESGKIKKYSEIPEEKTTQKYEAQPENMKTYANLLQKRVKSLSRARPTRAAVLQQSRMGEG